MDPKIPEVLLWGPPRRYVPLTLGNLHMGSCIQESPATSPWAASKEGRSLAGFRGSPSQNNLNPEPDTLQPKKSWFRV